MFDTFLHNHTIPTVDSDGELVSQRATCAEAQTFYGTHTGYQQVDDGNGGTKPVLAVVSCLSAEMERQNLLVTVRTQESTIGRQNGEILDLRAEVANYERLIAGAMQIVFRMGPALQSLLAMDLASPTLTDDRTAVKVENMLVTVLIDPFGERITVRPVSGEVPERNFAVVNGRLDEDAQTLLLGHIDRICKAALKDGSDPVKGQIGLVELSA